MKKILIIAGGGTKHLLPFKKAGEELGLIAKIASFSDLNYLASGGKVALKVDDQDIKGFDACYIRLVGKRFEELALLVNYCKKHKIRLVDSVFEREDLVRLPIPKSIEIKLLEEAGVSVPDTYFGSLENIKENAPKLFGYPFVIKETTGKQGHAVWSPRDEKELKELFITLLPMQRKEKKSFIAQKFIKSPQRSRIFVVGNKALVGITRPMRWRKRFIEMVNGEFPEGKREALNPIPEDQAYLAVSATKALGIDIAGVDILKDDKTGKLYLLEVNSAPRWEAVRKDTGINVEKEILKFIATGV